MRRVAMKLLRIAVTTMALVGAFALGVAPARAATADRVDVVPTVSVAPAGACDFHVGLTIKDGSYIRGSGSLANCGGPFNHLRIDLQRLRWNGWQNEDTAVITIPGTSAGVSFNCSGTGTYTYRTRVQAHNVYTNRWPLKYSNELRVSC
jgi:hypothetical protein